MTILISLFLISFIAITVMFNRKLFLLKNGDITVTQKENMVLEIPYILKIKNITNKKIKKYGYVILVTIIRLYFRSLNLLKRKYKELKTRIDNLNKGEVVNGTEKREVNKFLKGISDYKNKIKEIKHQIKEEENRM